MCDPFADEPRLAGDTSSVVTIGTFDGVHRGHQYLLESARARADDLGLPFIVVTFEPLPAQVLRPNEHPGRLTSADQRIRLLTAHSGGRVVVVRFSDDMRAMTARAFVDFLHDFAHIAELWVGEEFALGRDREGNVDSLTAFGRDLGFSVRAVARVGSGNAIVSSSRIRRLIIEGDIERAGGLLGRPFRVSGTVILGAQVGRTIGFPTANVEPPAGLVTVADGIYASHAIIGDDPTARPAMTYIGTRPALNTGNRLIETHLLDFSGDLYGQTLHTDFVARLRPDANFASVGALIAQLKVDEADARRALAKEHGRLLGTVHPATS